MPELRDATVVIGQPGLNGTGITAGEKTSITFTGVSKVVFVSAPVATSTSC